jgi:hypothetical protein
MKKIFFHAIPVLLLVLMLSCSSGIVPGDAWEGIEKNILRVFIKLDIPEDADRRNMNKAMKERLIDAGRDRAALLLISFTRIHLSEYNQIEACRRKIDSVTGSGRIISHQCSDISCTALIDYDIRDFLDAAGMPAAR